MADVSTAPRTKLAMATGSHGQKIRREREPGHEIRT
jgi:hypothetical protein